jgi:HK97 family phage prohead protease
VSGVDFADRIIELVAVPYDEETVVEYPPGSGRAITESVNRGAFDGLENRPGRVRVNRDHDVARTVGLARAIHTDRTNGLVAEAYISRTPLGDETLQLADDGVLGASVGMAVRPADQIWSAGRSRRRIAKAFLDHIALAPNPAYAGAEVLAVRTSPPPPSFEAPPATPYLDEVLEYLASLTRK